MAETVVANLNIKLTNKHITYVIYFLLIAGVIGIWIWEIKSFNELLNNLFIWEERYEVPNIIYGLQLSNLFTASIVSMVLIVGICLRNKTGWVLITSWFYFFLINFSRSLIKDGVPDTSIEFQLLLLFLVPFGFIILMNKFNGIKIYHGIENNNRIKLNLFAIGTGIILVGFLILKKNLLQHWL